jgi:carbon-monoxide dehydrogenase small subunit
VATDLIPLGDPTLRQRARLSLSVNGEPRELLVDSYKTLLELLREELQLTGTKHGCELGECGACAVLLDGELVLSCLVAAVECDGRTVQTVEGMQRGPELHPLQACFADHGAAQCGYCTPGFLLAAKELLERRPDASRAEIAEALSGQLCRCTGYLQIFEAVEAAAAQLRTPVRSSEPK